MLVCAGTCARVCMDHFVVAKLISSARVMVPIFLCAYDVSVRHLIFELLYLNSGRRLEVRLLSGESSVLTNGTLESQFTA